MAHKVKSVKDHSDRDLAQELLEDMIKEGSKRYAETTCDIDRIRGEELHKAKKVKKKK